MGEALLIEDVVEVAPVTRVRRRLTVPALPKIFGETPLYWWSLSAPDGEYHYAFVSETFLDSPQIKARAYTDFAQRLVLFGDNLLEPSESRELAFLFLHETDHVLTFGKTHYGTVRKILGGRSARAADLREEAWCDHAASARMPLVDAGVIRLPPLPRPAAIRAWRNAR